MLIASFVPAHFWAEAISTAVYLINMQPSSSLHGKSPGEMLFGSPPRYDHLRVFGCTCYVLLAPRERTKLTAQSVECVFLGYSLEHKGYRCYDPSARRIRISRDVTFDENKPFFYSSTSQSSSPTNSISFLYLPPIPSSDSFPSSMSPSLPPSVPSPTSLTPPSPPSPSFGPLPPSLNPTSPTPTVIPSTTTLHTFPFHYSRRSKVHVEPQPSSPIHDEPTDVIDVVPDCSTPPVRYNLRNRDALRAPNRDDFVVGAVLEPSTYQEAVVLPQWQLVMSEELAALERTNTWDLVPLPSHAVPITCKWVYKVKTKSDGSVERYKARLVARGFQQAHGRDYDETFAPVSHMTTVRTLVAVAASRSWTISQMDVKNAFLHGDLHEEVYMEPPPGVEVPSGYIWRLRRALYGLKQAPRAWFARFSSVICAAGFCPSDHDPALFVHTSEHGRTLLLLYVDDMLITGDDLEYIAFVKKKLSEQFMMSDLGPLSYFLGIEFTSTVDGYYLSQHRYIEDLLAQSGLTDTKTVTTPMELHVRLRPTDGTLLDDPSRYRHLVGSLVYLTVTRPDIAYAVHILSQFVSAPTSVHYGHLLRILRYLRGTATLCLFYAATSPLQLRAFSDSTWASDPADRQSVTGYCIFLGTSLLTWKSKKQVAVSRSSTEVELQALATTTSEIVWLHWLLADFGVSCDVSTPLLCDNTGAIQIANDPVKHELTKHIGVDASFTRSHCQQSTIALHYVPSELQVADFFTKAQTREHHRLHLLKLNVIDPP